MTTSDQTVLIASDDLSLVDRLVPLLRRSNLSVRRVLRAGRAREMVSREPFDLVIVSMSPGEIAGILTAARSSGSANERSALLAMIDPESEESEGVADGVNRVLPSDCSPAELRDAVATLLGVAPRADVRAPIKLRLGVGRPESPLYRVENLSESGMFVVDVEEDLPVGSEFGFALVLPGEERPILGKARVVRHGDPEREGMAGLGAMFLAIGGEGPDRIRALVEERAGVTETPRRPASIQSALGGTRPRAEPRSDGESTVEGPDLAASREELEEITPHLDELLATGLRRRFGVADWYVTGAELGLESLRAFYRILESVYSGTGASPEAERRLADLRVVHRALTEFAKPEQGAEGRVRIMLEIRRPLERLLIELSETGRLSDHIDGEVDHRGMVSHLVSDIRRFVGIRSSLERLQSELLELQRLWYLVARRTCRDRVREIRRRYGKHGRSLGFEGRDSLESRKGRRAALVAVDREIRRIDERMKAIHGRVYEGRFLPRATGSVPDDMAKEALSSVLADVLLEGYEYLVRAYSAYRHALEVTGSDPGLLERAARLALVVETAGGHRGRFRPSDRGEAETEVPPELGRVGSAS